MSDEFELSQQSRMMIDHQSLQSLVVVEVFLRWLRGLSSVGFDELAVDVVLFLLNTVNEDPERRMFTVDDEVQASMPCLSVVVGSQGYRNRREGLVVGNLWEIIHDTLSLDCSF
jgi:hypothetical protein